MAPSFSISILGADDRDRTGDLVLTKDALCQLSYIGSPDLDSRQFLVPGRVSQIQPANAD